MVAESIARNRRGRASLLRNEEGRVEQKRDRNLGAMDIDFNEFPVDDAVPYFAWWPLGQGEAHFEWQQM
jgi:hypothetical protein